MIPTRAAIARSAARALAARMRAQAARRALHRSLKETAVSPPVLISGVIGGFFAARAIARRPRTALAHSLRAGSRLTRLYSLFRVF